MPVQPSESELDVLVALAVNKEKSFKVLSEELNLSIQEVRTLCASLRTKGWLLFVHHDVVTPSHEPSGTPGRLRRRSQESLFNGKKR